jgi:hypothetical protein
MQKPGRALFGTMEARSLNPVFARGGAVTVEPCFERNSNVECSFLANERPLFDVLLRPLPFGTDNHRKHFPEKISRILDLSRTGASLECQPAFDFH